VLRIGLTGGIGAGKSTAAERFGELGARVIDHDYLARRAVEPGSAALADIVGEFGDRVVRGGLLDRASLAAIVFSDDEARGRLEEIIHPYVRAAASAADRQARAEGVGVVVHDIPLLVESGQGGDFDLVVCVTAPLSIRVLRLYEGRGLTPDEAMARVLAQASDEDRAAVSDVDLDGAGTVEQLRAHVDEFWSTHLP
jgi:dephospho-CoA kinase